MADGQRRTFRGREGIKKESAAESREPQGNEHRNRRRQKLYATDPGYASRAKKAARDTYRKDHPLPGSRLGYGLLSRGQQKEVIAGDMDHPQVVEAYTIPEAAVALGRSELCVKRWIANGIIPPPLLVDTVRSYRHYSVGELRIIAEALYQHEQEFRYLSASHTRTITEIWQRLQGYRALHI